MPGPTVARAPEGLFQYLWAKVHQVMVPMMAWAEDASRSTPKTPSTLSEKQKAALVETYGKLPLAFEQNQGQTDASVKFLARGNGYTFFLTPTEIVLGFHHQDHGARQGTSAQTEQGMNPEAPAVVRLQFVGANPDSLITGREPLPTKVNYFIGNDQSQWHTAIPTFGAVDYSELYPGIDLHYYGTQRQMEFDWIVAPDADPAQITLGIQGAMVRLDTQGDLLLELPTGEVRLKKPVAYQRINGIKQPVEVHYVVEEEGQKERGLTEKNEPGGTIQVTLQVAAYDRSETLIIDPVLTYSTFLGGSGNDTGIGIAVDSAGNAYVTGVTGSADFPLGSALQGTNGGGNDAFVAKLNAAGSALVYSTYLGGSGDDFGDDLAVDSAGNAYVAGATDSVDFPLASALQGAFGGVQDSFVAKLNPAGSALVYSTYLGGSASESDNTTDLAVDSVGNAYITGDTDSTDFPLASPLQGTIGGGVDAFVTKINPGGTALVYSTYLGGSGDDGGLDIAVDSSGNAYVTGETASGDFPLASALQGVKGGGTDAFVTKVNAAGSALTYSTYLGGSGNEVANGIAVDSSGNAYVTGETNSANFPTASAFQGAIEGGAEAFVAKVNAAGSALVYSTYIGGSLGEIGESIAVDTSGNAYVTGSTLSANFPLASALQGTFGGGVTTPGGDAFVTKLNATGSALAFSTYLGGSGEERGAGIAVDGNGDVYVTGVTDSPNFPTASFQSTLGGGSDAFVTKITIIATTPSATVPPSVGGSPSFIQSLTLIATANGETLDSTTVNVTPGETVTAALEVSAGSNRMFSAKVFDGANGTGRCRFTASSNPLELTGGTAVSVTLNLATCPSTNALSGQRAYVTNSGDGTVSVIDTTTNSVLTTVTVGAGADGVAITPDGTTVLVTNQTDDTVSKIDTTTNTVTGTLAVGNAPQDVAITPDGTTAYVANKTDGTMSVINLATFSVVATIPVVSSPDHLAITPDGTKVYVGGGVFNRISVIATATNTVTATLTVESAPILDIGVQPNGARVYVSNGGSDVVSVLNPATNTVVAAFTTVTSPNCCVFSPDSTTLYVNKDGTNMVAEIATATNTVTAIFTVGTGTLGDAVFTPDGAHAYVANLDTDHVSVVDPTTRTVVATISVGNAPEGIAIIP